MEHHQFSKSQIVFEAAMPLMHQKQKFKLIHVWLLQTGFHVSTDTIVRQAVMALTLH